MANAPGAAEKYPGSGVPHDQLVRFFKSVALAARQPNPRVNRVLGIPSTGRKNIEPASAPAEAPIRSAA